MHGTDVVRVDDLGTTRQQREGRHVEVSPVPPHLPVLSWAIDNSRRSQGRPERVPRP